MQSFLAELKKNHKKLLTELKSGKISDKEMDQLKTVSEKISKTF